MFGSVLYDNESMKLMNKTGSIESEAFFKGEFTHILMG